MKKIKKEMSSLVRSNFTPLVETKEGLLLGGFGEVFQSASIGLRTANNCSCDGNNCNCANGGCEVTGNNCTCNSTSTTFAKSTASKTWGSFI